MSYVNICVCMLGTLSPAEGSKVPYQRRGARLCLLDGQSEACVVYWIEQLKKPSVLLSRHFATMQKNRLTAALLLWGQLSWCFSEEPDCSQKQGQECWAVNLCEAHTSPQGSISGAADQHDCKCTVPLPWKHPGQWAWKWESHGPAKE